MRAFSETYPNTKLQAISADNLQVKVLADPSDRGCAPSPSQVPLGRIDVAGQCAHPWQRSGSSRRHRDDEGLAGRSWPLLDTSHQTQGSAASAVSGFLRDIDRDWSSTEWVPETDPRCREAKTISHGAALGHRGNFQSVVEDRPQRTPADTRVPFGRNLCCIGEKMRSRGLRSLLNPTP